MPCVSCGRRGYWIARSSQAMTRQVDRKLNPTNRGPVAQGIEHLPSKQRVEGSNPSGTANTLKPETGNPVTRASPQAAPRQSQAKPVYTTPIGCLNIALHADVVEQPLEPEGGERRVRCRAPDGEFHQAIPIAPYPKLRIDRPGTAGVTELPAMSHDRSKDGQGIKIDGISPQGLIDGLSPYVAQEVAMLFFEQVSNLPLALDGPPDETSLNWPGEGHGFVHTLFASIRLNLEALEFSPAPGNGTGIDRPKFDC